MEHLETEYCIVITTISSIKQGLMGDSSTDQEKQIKRRIEQFSKAISTRILIKKNFDFIESRSGELDVQPILKVLEYCKDPKNKIKYAFIKSIDRSTRGGAVVYGSLVSQFSRYGVQLIDVYGVIGTKNVNTLDHLGVKYKWSEFSPTWITELLEAERAKGEVRDILTRMIGAEIRYVRLGYRVRSAPPGYKNIKTQTLHGERVILAPHDEEAKWFIKMYELRIQGNLEDEEIVDEINEMGYKSRIKNVRDFYDKTKVIGNKGGNPLTIKQLRKYLQNPIYAGVSTEKWTEGKPIRAKFDGLVTVEMFNRANRGTITIVGENEQIFIFKGKQPQWQLIKNRNNPLYPYKQYVLCPICRKPLLGSASRGKMGKHFPAYHCNRGHYFRIALKDFCKVINDFCRNLKFSDGFKKELTKIVIEEWEKREKQVSDKTVSLNKRLIEVEQEKRLLKEKIKMLSTPTSIKMIEEDIDNLELTKVSLIQKRDIKEEEQFSIQGIINYITYFMEHLHELLLEGSDKAKNAAMFSLVFQDTPTYEELVNGTPKLSPLFALNQQYEKSKFLSVSLQGLEP